MEQAGICYIVGGGEFDASSFCPTKEDYIVAADSGLVYIEESGFVPHLIVGDFDSLGYRPKGDNVICHPVEKDDTDLALATDVAWEKGYRRFYLFGVSGGRLDHTLANLQLLTSLCQKGAEVYFFSPDCMITAITCGTLHFGAEHRGNISVFAATDEAERVTIRGLKYSLEDAVLVGSHALGVSNEFMGSPADVSSGRGVLWILWEKNGNCEIPVFERAKTQ